MTGEEPATAPSEEAVAIEAESMEVSNEAVALIIIEEAPAVETLGKPTLPEIIEESAVSPVEVQTAEEATLEAKEEPKAKEVTPAKKAAAKPKKAPATTKSSKE